MGQEKTNEMGGFLPCTPRFLPWKSAFWQSGYILVSSQICNKLIRSGPALIREAGSFLELSVFGIHLLD